MFAQTEREENSFGGDLIDASGFSCARRLHYRNKFDVMLLGWFLMDLVNGFEQDPVCITAVFRVPSSDYS
jgi:hypothetical protein